MSSETILITVPDGTAEAYVSRPDEADHPGVLLHADAIGLRPQIEQMADHIASWGYVVMAPHVFYRDGSAADLAPTADLTRPGAREEFFVGAMQRVRALTPDRSDHDLDAYLDALLRLDGVSGGRVGMTGYCIGGRLAVRAAGLRPDVIAAAAAFHPGGLVTDEPDSPHRVVARASAEILVGHADQDSSNPAEAVAIFESALAAAGLTFTSAIYPGAPHGFTMADTSSYDDAGAERHYVELRALLERTLPA
ncbi:dienelactone hydrolase family protein [Aeromicrobium fastidiosum]|uniref:Dienelactone hydrolase family protein n=1 Tax=Aeromicrobium fastidiosum TaxID=52699 RepID=A0A641ART2_9ACTN|nr:dienelactone hydrolase family protein [Aeromicrobium fastidiosum]KAA1380655.1 dienelactone hydrolase family protein [Aeromicrobium fastidiosum]MBP2390263.1 carboxymethylenebutenolidase [Aeromicrobium fastidiosum]